MSPVAPPFSALFLLSEPVTGSHVRGRAVEDEPGTFEYLGGSGIADVIWLADERPLVSERVQRILTAAAVTGWKAEPAEFRTKTGRVRGDFALLEVTGRVGSLDFSRSETLEKITSAGRERIALGRYFDRDTWDGSMIFRPEGARDIVVTDRVRSLFERTRIGNVLLRSLDSVEVSAAEYDRWIGDSDPGGP